MSNVDDRCPVANRVKDDPIAARLFPEEWAKACAVTGKVGNHLRKELRARAELESHPGYGRPEKVETQAFDGWFVWNVTRKSKRLPRVCHPSAEAAKVEAQRLATFSPECLFIVVQGVAQVWNRGAG